ncbi:GntR family transcriptional regulator [Streptomyces noursei]|uniref:GntR family transcriptional regulator n=1 Tax=Streptomyces noursei TaxID=1971 RepID=UPI0035D7B4AC
MNAEEQGQPQPQPLPQPQPQCRDRAEGWDEAAALRDAPPLLRRRGGQRLAREWWGAGRSVWSAEVGARELVVDQVAVTEEAAPAAVAHVLGMASGEPACVRRRRFVLDGKPVLWATSFLPAALVAGSAVVDEDTGPGGVYARLAELGSAPVHFREEVRSRMPSEGEVDRLRLGAGTPVIVIVRTAFADGGRAVEVNEMVLDSAAYVLEYDVPA